jgi:hypothetical protein
MIPSGAILCDFQNTMDLLSTSSSPGSQQSLYYKGFQAAPLSLTFPALPLCDQFVTILVIPAANKRDHIKYKIDKLKLLCHM